MDQEILDVFFYDVRCAVVMHFSSWSAVYYEDDQMLLAWPPRFPDVTPCDFFLWDFQGSGLCSSSSCKYPGTEGTNYNRH